MNVFDKERANTLVSHFAIPHTVTEIIPWGNGLINDTYRIKTDSDFDYLMQNINVTVYADIDGIMENIFLVTETIREKKFQYLDGRQKQELQLICTREGKYYYKHTDGSCWRMYNFMQDAYSMESATEIFEVFKAAVLLGQFHYLLKDFPVEQLHITTPDFHNPKVYYEKLMQAAEDDVMGRRASVYRDLAFLSSRAERYDVLDRMHEAGELPLRVNHNDAKINNIMFDEKTREPICMIDFDTVMPGYLAYDFGDAVRSAMCTGKDLGPNMDYFAFDFDLVMYKEILHGFLEGCQGMLTEGELESLHLGVRLIFLESAMRYLTDYLQGDIYFKVKYPEQNKVKCRMHMRMYQDMLRKTGQEWADEEGNIHYGEQ